ncbi:Hypothetical predicted protein, partial [Paramuricea clavata]
SKKRSSKKRSLILNSQRNNALSAKASYDYTRDLSEKHERLLQEKNVLEEKKQKAHELFQNLQAKSQETRHLEEELIQLANQNTSFSDKSGGLRH